MLQLSRFQKLIMISMVSGTLLISCGKSNKDSEDAIQNSPYDKESFISQSMKKASFTFTLANAEKASQLLRKPTQDVYISKGKIGKFSEVVTNDYQVVCKFETWSEKNYVTLKSQLKANSVRLTVTSVDSGSTNSSGHLIEYVTFNLNVQKDLTLSCSKFFVNSEPILVEDIKNALAGTLNLVIFK